MDSIKTHSPQSTGIFHMINWLFNKNTVKDKEIDKPFDIKMRGLSIPIWFQLSITFAFVLSASIVALMYVIAERQHDKLYNQALEMGIISLNFFSSNACIPLLKEDTLTLNTLLKNTEGVEGHLYAFITNKSGVIMAHTDQSKIGTVYKPIAGIREVNIKGRVTYFNYMLDGKQKVVNMSIPVLFNGKELGDVHVGLSVNFIDQMFHDERSFLIFYTLNSVFVGIMVAVMFGLRFSKPISKLVTATREISRGNYKYQVDLKRNDELGRLAKAFNMMGAELEHKAMMKQSFGRYVGNEILDMIMVNPENQWLKSTKKEATVLFADIRGFTAYSETKDPEQIVEKLNEYFEIATRVIMRYGGYIDKFIGDAVLGVFGVPADCSNHAEQGIRAAIDMQREFAEVSKNGNDLLSRVGIGIKTGEVVAGNIGSQAKMEYTVVGDSVNIASKLNGFAMSGEIIVDLSVCEVLKDKIRTIPLAPQKIKGRSGLVRIYKVIGIND